MLWIFAALAAVHVAASGCYLQPDPLPAPRVRSNVPAFSVGDLPKSWDWREKSTLTDISTQFRPNMCGCCWSLGSTASLADRFRIATGGSTPPVKLAAQVLLNCGTSSNPGSCHGGSWEYAFGFMHDYGITDETCMPFEGVDNSFNPELPCVDRMCAYCDLDGTCYAVNGTRYFADEWGYVNGSSAIMSEIYARGPVACSMYAHTQDFLHYKGGVIDNRTKFQPGNTTHVISLLGWGETVSGTPYWIARNSFGTVWGEQGWFRIVRGINSLNIESHCGWATPRV